MCSKSQMGYTDWFYLLLILIINLLIILHITFISSDLHYFFILCLFCTIISVFAQYILSNQILHLQEVSVIIFSMNLFQSFHIAYLFSYILNHSPHLSVAAYTVNILIYPACYFIFLNSVLRIYLTLCYFFLDTEN